MEIVNNSGIFVQILTNWLPILVLFSLIVFVAKKFNTKAKENNLENLSPNQTHSGTPQNKKNLFIPFIVLSILVLGGLGISYFTVIPTPNSYKEIPINQLIEAYEKGNYAEIEIRGQEIIATNLEGEEFIAHNTQGENLSELGLIDANNPTPISMTSNLPNTFWTNALASWLPILIFAFLVIFIAKQLSRRNKHNGIQKTRNPYSKDYKTGL